MKGKKRISLLAALVCIFALVFSLGIMSACGNSDSGNAQVTESASGNWYYGSVLPAEGLGEEGDFYLNTKTLASYKKTAAGWSTVSLEESGEWLYGVGQPDAEVGSANDFYLDTQNGDLYHKTATGWENILQLFGKNGRDGVVWFSGNGKPTELPKGSMAGDFYLDYPLFDVYQLGEDGKTWNWLGSLKGSDGETPALPEAEKVTVTFDVNGGKALEAESVEVPKGDSIAALPVPTRKNYTFLGWFTGTDVNDGQVTTVTPISRSMTLVAHWVFSGKYTFDSVIVDGAAINPTDGSEFYLGSTHTIEFHAHGADDSFLQIWYSVNEKEGESLWNSAIGGKTYTKGYVGLTQRGASGEMTLTLSSAEFTDAGTYFVWMETDGRTSLRYKFTAKAMPEITPSAEVKLEDGVIENPTETKTLYAGNAKTYNFILSHNAISSISKASAEATGKPRLVLGMNISFPGASGYDVVETQDTYDNKQPNRHPETVPYQYTFVYGEENNRWFGNDPNRPVTYSSAYEFSHAKVDGVVRISNFELGEGYIGFTLEINITSLGMPSGCTAVSINPTLVYEFGEGDEITRFDVIGNKKLEEGGEKTKFALSYEKTQLATTFVVNSLFYNSVTTGRATFTYKGSPEDFEFNGFYINGQSIEENESYNDGTIKLLYRYLGVTEEKGECTATVDVYAFEVLEASDTKYIYSVDYTFKGAQATLQSQTYQYNRLKDAEVRLEFDAFLLEAWHHMVNEEKWVGSQDKKVQYAQQLVNELWENRASLTLTDYELITESSAANGLHTKVLSGGSPFGTTSNDAANVACQAFVAGLLETYDGVSRMTIYQWIKTYLGRQSFSNSDQSNAISQFLMLVFYGFSDQMFGYGSRSAPVGFLNANLFGSVENYLYMLGLIFDRVAPQTTPELLDAVASRAADSETDALIHDAYIALQQAFNAYHANPNEATLADYASAVDNYTYSIDPRKKGNSNRTAYDFATQHLTDVSASLAVEDPQNKALIDAAVAAQALVVPLATKYSNSTLTIEELSEYTQKMEAYIDAIDAFTAEIADFNTITFCKEIWTTAQAARGTKSLSAMQTLAYDALQSYRQKGEAEGASASDIEKYAEKTRLYLHADDAEDNKTLKTDIDAFLEEKYSTTDGLKEYFKLDNLVIAYDYWIVRSGKQHSNVAGHPLSQFADLYVKYVVNAEKGTATEEYLTLADAFLQDQLLRDTSWKLSQHIGSIPVFLMKGTDYESIRDAWFADKSNSAKAQAYFEVVQYSLISCTIAGRGERNATYSATIGERLEKVVDKVAEYLKKPEYSKFITDQKTALQTGAGEAYEAFKALDANKVFGGWHGMQFCNMSKVTLAQIAYEKVTWRDGVYKRKFVDQNITNEATSAMQLSGFELIKVVYNDYVSDEYSEKKDLIAYDLYNLLSESFGAIWSDYWSYHADGQPSNIKSVTVLTKEADDAQAKL